MGSFLIGATLSRNPDTRNTLVGLYGDKGTFSNAGIRIGSF
jgi:hypothetical protein